MRKLVSCFVFASFWMEGMAYENLAAKMLYVGSYENGTIEGWRKTDIGWLGHSVNLVTAPVRRGRYAARFELRLLDPLVTGTFRNELSVGRHGYPEIAAMGQEYWYGFSIYIPADWENDGLRDELAQFHAPPDPGEIWRNPPLGFDTKDGNWEIWNRWDRRAIQTDNAYESGHRLLWKGALQKGQWNDWVVHVKWSYQSDGFLEIWLNDQKVVDDNGPNCYNDQSQRYFKWGVYKRAWSNEGPPFATDKRVIYNDELRIGDEDSSYDEVAPGSAGD